MSDPAHHPPLLLDGSSLTIEDLVRVARDPRPQVEISEEAFARVRNSWSQIEQLAKKYREGFERLQQGEDVHPVLEYGVTTGFGEFKDIAVSPSDLEQLQRNILLSHCAGVGETTDPGAALNYFEAEVVRAALVIRLNAFLKGNSGVRPDLVRTVQAMINRGIVPLIPIRGSVGSSGDLCPLAHLFAVLLGEGEYVVVSTPEEARAALANPYPASGLASHLGCEPLAPSFKEGLALTNGATFSAALLALVVYDAEHLALVADAGVALSVEAVCGCSRAFDPRIHEARGQTGQIASAAKIRELLKGSKLVEKAGAVQDVYSIRCAPAVHGAARDLIAYARRIVQTELNAATDNPLFFPVDGTPPWDHEFEANWPAGYSGKNRISFSAGNFHGEPVGIAADCLAIGLAELANISERRVQMLLDSHHNRNLPSNLIPHRGVNSGFMIAQYSAASLVSENKVLTHPASVDSIPTSSNSEDHNAMATIACRKLRTVLRNAQAVLAIELLVATQAVEWRVAMEVDPRSNHFPGPVPGQSSGTSRDDPHSRWERAETEAREFAERTAPSRRPEIAARLGEGTVRAYLRLRELVPPLLRDRLLADDIRRLRRAIEAQLLP